MANDVISEPSAEVLEVIEHAIGFAALAKDGKHYRLKTRTSDLIHTMGYFCAQTRSGSPKEQLALIARSLNYLADRLS